MQSWQTAKTNVVTICQGLGTAVASAWDTMKGSISGKLSSITSDISSKFNAAKYAVTNIFTSMKYSMVEILEGARDKVKSAIDKLRSLFNFSWSLPHLKLPHISITGRFSISPPSVPHFSISWYKKAMDNGMILNSPTIFGMKGNQLLAGGEAGSETVVGTQSLMEMIRDAVTSMAGGTTINYGGVNINVYQKENQDIRALADEIEYRINNNVMRRRAAFGT